MKNAKKTQVTGKPYPYYDTVPQVHSLMEMLKAKLESMPDHTVYSYPDKKEKISKSYRQFEQDVLNTAAWLKEQNLDQSHIGLALPNSYLWIVLFYALALCGGVSAAVNPGLPPAEIEQMLKQADCKAVIAKKGLLKKLENTQIRKIEEKEVLEVLNHPAALKLEDLPDLDPDRLCSLFFTSGTTDQSKAVMLSERNIISDIDGSCALFVPDPDGSTLAVLPFFHSFGFVTGILMPLHYGVETYIASSMRRITQDLQNIQPAEMFMVPLIVETVHKRIWTSIKKSGRENKVRKAMQLSKWLRRFHIDIRNRLFQEIQQNLGGRLQYVICGGAFLEPSYVDDFREWGIEILPGYGITECSPVACVNRNHFQKSGSAGQLVKGLEMKTSESGELFMKGDMVFKGYYNDPQRTEEAFENGWFKTGDIGYVDEDQFLFLTGRTKNLIILSNGENISPEQIELELSRIEGVQEILVYEENGVITAEIFPEEEYLGQQDWFEKQVSLWNHDRPIDHQVKAVKLRQEEFKKNASAKIIRSSVQSDSDLHA